MSSNKPSNIAIQDLDTNFKADTLSSDPTSLQWIDGYRFTLEGLGWPESSTPYTRLPHRCQTKVRDIIWELSRYSAGVCIRFLSDTEVLSVRWDLSNERLAMPHMPAIGASGIDLYLRDPKTQTIRWAAVARPESVSGNEQLLLQDQPKEIREYFLYLPLYNGIRNLKIGVTTHAKVEPAQSRSQKPICFYGASMVQGACASRPGMALPAQVGRRLEYPILNFGFSGNSWAEPEMATLLAEIDPALYVIGPAPSLKIEFIHQNLAHFLQTLRSARPEVPIVLIENALYQDAWTRPARKAKTKDTNKALRIVYEELKKPLRRLYFLENEFTLGENGDATVDGTHPTDLGFLRFTEALTPELKKILSHTI